MFGLAIALSCGAEWTKHGGLNCTDGSSAGWIGRMPLDECKARCTTASGCAAVAVLAEEVEWQRHGGLNCYRGHGATELIDGDGTVDSCFAMTLEECKTQCLVTGGCIAVEWNRVAHAGACCLRADIELQRCDRSSGGWDLHAITRRAAVPPPRRLCRLLPAVAVAACDGQSDAVDTHVLRSEGGGQPWWLTTHFAERAFMPRHYSCDRATPNATCTLRQLARLLPAVVEQGYSVVNVDWPVEAGPDSLYEGFGAKDYWSVDPLLGTQEDWAAFVGEAHRLDLKVVIDFNPSYFWTGAPAFQRALRDVREYGTAGLPANSTARWFRWNSSCGPSAPTQPPDGHPANGVTDGWVRSPAAQACYWSIWGKGQPCADLASPAWRRELTAIVVHWVRSGVDGFMLDAPPFYLAAPRGDDPISGRYDAAIARAIREVIVEPAHALGAAVFGETYNLLRPTLNKMLDGGRNTDMPSGVRGFPGRLHALVLSGNASGVERLLAETVDVLGRWSGGAVRTEPDDSSGEAEVAALKAAVTALTAGYYVVRMGPYCSSPHRSYGPSPPGDEWPDGCFGKWAGADGVAPTLKAIRGEPALRPGTARRQLGTADPRVYAALRGGDVVVVFNFSPRAAVAEVAVAGSGMRAPQQPRDLIGGGAGPPVPAAGAWRVPLAPWGWRVLGVSVIK